MAKDVKSRVGFSWLMNHGIGIRIWINIPYITWKYASLLLNFYVIFLEIANGRFPI